MAKKIEAATEKRLWLRLTKVCNQRCLFCHDRQAQDGTTASLKEVRLVLEEGRREGLRRVVLSGGEPSLHPRFLEVIALARKLGYRHVQAITNGRKFCYPEFLKRAVAAGLNEATFSLHGHTRELHESLTRTPGSFIQSLAALRAALAVPGLIVSVDVVVCRKNVRRLREMLDFFIHLGVHEFDLLHLVPFGDAWENRGELFYDPDAELPHLRRAFELSRDPRIRIWTNRLPPKYLEGFERLIQPPDKILDEARGRESMLTAFLNGGVEPPCRGDRCCFCFLQGLCEDIEELLRRGVLEGKPVPPCLSSREGAGKPRFMRKKDILPKDFASFFIRHRYFLRASTCGVCARKGDCQGLSVSTLRESGPPKPL